MGGRERDPRELLVTVVAQEGENCLEAARRSKLPLIPVYCVGTDGTEEIEAGAGERLAPRLLVVEGV